MGLKTSPSRYQTMVSYCLDSIKLKPYIDDVLKGTAPNIDTGQVVDTVDKQHDIQLQEVFTLFRKYKLTVKKTKMHLFVRKVKFCRHILFNGQRMSSPEKRAAIEKWRWEDIRTPKHLKSFSWFSPNGTHLICVITQNMPGICLRPCGNYQNRPQRIRDALHSDIRLFGQGR